MAVEAQFLESELLMKKIGFSELSEGGDLLSTDEEKGLIHGLEKAYRYKNIRNWGV